jgi:tetratricopeptide (TPR) repeat protein
MNEPYDETLGLKENPDAEMLRYGRFMTLEPSAPAPRAAIASSFLDGGTSPEAVGFLQGKVEGQPDQEIDKASADAFYSFQLIRGLIFMGSIEAAEQEFAAWAHPEEGHLYHRTAAIVAEHSDGDFKKAMLHYDEAAKSWPAPVDQRFQGSHVGCARKAGEAERAKELEAKYKSLLEIVMEPVVQNGLHNAIDLLPKPEAVKAFATFYEKLGRMEDSKRWLETLETTIKVEVQRPAVDEGF